MANFEGLIRGAIATKGATTSEERAVIYQSSRNALQRLIADNRSLTVENVVAEQQSLEEAIARIEQEFVTPPAPPPMVESSQEIQEQASGLQLEEMAQPVAADSEFQQPIVEQDFQPEPVEEVAEPSPQTAPRVNNPEDDPLYEIQQVLSDDAFAPASKPALQLSQPDQRVQEPQPAEAPIAEMQTDVSYSDENTAPQNSADPFEYSEPEIDEPVAIPPGFSRRRKSQRIWFWLLFVIIILALLAWISYRVFLGAVDGSLFGYQSSSTPAVSRDAGQTDEQSNYITILEPGDLTAMVVSDRGRVEIVNEQSLEMIRLLSVRDKADRSQSAKPILIKLKPGVIEQIRGKRVTAEIYARSGSSRAAQFAVECMFGQSIGCGRKRFHIGVQPEASIFAFTMEKSRSISEEAFIAINTDITDNAEITGEGDVLDIVYVRLRTAKE